MQGGLDTPQAIKNKKSAAYYAKASDNAFDRKDYREMKRILDEGIRLYPDNSKLWSEMIRYYYKSKLEPDTVKREGALKAAARMITLNPSNKNDEIIMGWVCQNILKDCSSALFYYERTWKAHATKRPALYFFMARCYEELDYPEKAEDYYERFLHAAPEHKHADEACKRLAILKPRFKEEQNIRRQGKYGSSAAKKAKKAEGDYLRVCINAFDRKDCREMKGILDEGTHFYPESSDLFHLLGSYYLMCKLEPDAVRIEGALKAVLRAMTLDPSGKNYAGMGWGLSEHVRRLFLRTFLLQKSREDPCDKKA